MLEELLSQVNRLSRTIAIYQGRVEALQANLTAHEAEVSSLEGLDVSYQKLQKFFQGMGTADQEKLQRWFEQVVTYGMQSVFGELYRFSIVGPEIKANELAISFRILKRHGDAELELDPYNEMGGGIADVLAFLLQFIMVLLLKDRINPIMFLDEAFKHVSPICVPRLADLLKELVDKTTIQIVLVTHEPIFVDVGDVVYRFTHNGIETLVAREL